MLLTSNRSGRVDHGRPRGLIFTGLIFIGGVSSIWWFVAIGISYADPPAEPVPTSTPSQPSLHDWATYNYDVTGWRFNRAESTLSPKNVSGLAEQWRFPDDTYPHVVGTIHATPSVVDGEVYFGTVTYPAFYKLTADGKVAWRYLIDPDALQPRQQHQATRLVPLDGVYGSALVTDTTVYFGDAKGKFYALDRQTGKPRWIVDSRSPEYPGAHQANLFFASPILAAGQVVVGGGAYEHAAVRQPGYPCCRGRGAVVAFDPDSGQIIWKYDVGPTPEQYDPPVTIRVSGVDRVYHYGPSTSSVWSTPSYDATSNRLFFGTDVHNAPRKPTADDPRLYTRHSAAIIAIDASDGGEKWITQLSPNDIWNHTLPTYDASTGQYKDQSIGDTPKVYTIQYQGKPTEVVGVGSKNGAFYVLRVTDGKVLHHTPLYQGPPDPLGAVNSRTLALPSAIGGLQTGCATDGRSVFTNGIDAPNHFPIGGRVTSISLDTTIERWRHERPLVPLVQRPPGRGDPFHDVGDPVACGIALANGVAFFTTLVSNRLVALDTANGEVLCEIPLGPVFSGPSVSRGRVYVGSGNTLFSPGRREDFFPKRYTGTLYCFGLAD